MRSLNKEIILAYLSTLKDELAKDGIIKLGLFGSYAKDKADIASDIDIVICSSKEFLAKFKGFEALIYLDELRQKLMKEFKIQVDICDIFSMDKTRQKELLQGALYV